jgi:hypothetical protein
LLQLLAELRAECAIGIPDRIRSKVKEIVPEYHWVPTEGEVHVPAPLLHDSQLFGDQVPLANANG